MMRPLLLFVGICAANMVNAQRYFGVATSEYSSYNSLFLNPASIAGCNEKVVVNIFSIGVSADNNLGTFSKLSELGNTNAFTNSGGNQFSMLVPVAEVRGPGVLIGLNDPHKQTFALTTRVRGINQFNNFNQSLYKTVTDGTNSSNQNYTFQTSDFNWTAHIWSELGLSYGIVVVDNDESQLKAGITLRYLGGIDYLTLKGNNLNVRYTSGNDTFYASQSDIEYGSNILSANNAISNGVSTSNLLGSFFGSKQGGGLGADVGVSYSYIFGGGGPGSSEDSHKLGLSASVTDIGAVKYKEGNNFVVNVTGNGYLTGKGLSDHLNNYNDFRNYIVTQGFTADTGSRSTKVYMPTAFLFGADYQIYQHIYVNATYIANLANRQNYGNSYYNQLTITPHYDMKLLSAALPITYSALAHDMKIGMGFRIGGFFFGSDDMLALFSNHQHGFGFYMGGCIPIFKKTDKADVK